MMQIGFLAICKTTWCVHAVVSEKPTRSNTLVSTDYGVQTDYLRPDTGTPRLEAVERPIILLDGEDIRFRSNWCVFLEASAQNLPPRIPNIWPPAKCVASRGACPSHLGFGLMDTGMATKGKWRRKIQGHRNKVWASGDETAVFSEAVLCAYGVLQSMCIL